MVVDLVVDLLQSGYRVRLQVGGGSMAPTIQSGDTVVIEPIRLRDLARTDVVGSVVLCREQFGRMRLHRAVGRCADNPGHLITRGDSQPDCDLPRRMDDVLGRVVRIERSWARRLWRAAEKAAAFCLPALPHQR